MSQIFKEIFPCFIFINFIKNISLKEKNKYFFDINLYKKAEFNGNIKLFIDEVKPYYRNSKQFYVERKKTYKNFLTILRQLCKLHNIKYDTHIKYHHNEYTIEYMFFLDDFVDEHGELD
jgi:hypothetical protein